MAPAAAASPPTHQSPTTCTCRGAGPCIRNQDQPGGLGVSFVDEVVANVAANEGDVEQDHIVPGEDDRGVVAELAGHSARAVDAEVRDGGRGSGEEGDLDRVALAGVAASEGR